MKKIAIIASHPVQYNAPWFKLLAQSPLVKPKVFYTWEQSGKGAKYDPDFAKEIEWDIPLLEGYEYTFVKNIATDPGSHHFKGIVNPTLNEEIMEWGPDAVLIIGWSFHSHLQSLRYFHKKVPVLFRGDSTLLDDRPGIKRQLRYLFLRWVYRHVDYALYVGANNKDYFEKCGLKEDQLILAPHAIDNARFTEPDRQYSQVAKDWRASLEIRDEDLVVLFAGKLEPKKNPFFLLELAARIPDKRLKIIFTGNGVLENSLKQAARADHRVLFLDFQNQLKMPIVYRLGDIFLLPSQGPGETWGLGANEAMASGCIPLLSDRTGGAIDLIKEGRNGIIFSITDFDKCKALIESLIVDKERVAAMKKASRELIRAFSFEHIVKAIESIP
jgi:glycosyltransferase involved in cell wall biosynthesis